MIDYNKEIVSALKTILPTHYEMALTKETEAPCISYMELTNVDTKTGSTLGYSKIVFQIKIWANSLKTIEENALLVDSKMRSLGFKRISSSELNDKNSTMIQKILNYECLALENY